MKGSNVEKIARLADYFTKHPTQIGRYVRYARSFPLQVKLPWISWPAIDFLDGYVTKNMSIFEYGSGGSTLFFGQRGHSVRAVEHDAEWYETLRKSALPENVELVSENVSRSSGSSHQALDYISALRDRYDIVMIDGLDDAGSGELNPLRLKCFAHALEHINGGGIIIIDDAWRYDDISFDTGNPIRTLRFRGPGPGRWGVTRTDVYFYE